MPAANHPIKEEKRLPTLLPFYLSATVFAIGLTLFVFSVGLSGLVYASKRSTKERLEATRPWSDTAAQVLIVNRWFVPLQSAIRDTTIALASYAATPSAQSKEEVEHCREALKAAYELSKPHMDELEFVNDKDRQLFAAYRISLEGFAHSIEAGESSDANMRKTVEDLTNLWHITTRTTGHVLAINYAPAPGDLMASALRGLAPVFRELLALRASPSIPAELKTAVDGKRLGIAAGLLLLGVLYVGAFAPLGWYFASRAGLHPLDAMLFGQFAPAVEDAFRHHLFPWLSGPGALPVFFAVLTLVGALMLAAAIGALADGVRIGLQLRSLMSAYFMTQLAGSWLGTVPAETLTSPLFILKASYALASFTILSSVPDLLGKRGTARNKYDRLCSQFYGLVAGFVLSRSFGAQAALFSSVIFFICLFLAASAWELMFKLNPRIVPAAVTPIPLFTLNEAVRNADDSRRWAVLVVCVTPPFHVLLALVYSTILIRI